MKVIAIGDPHFRTDNIPEVELFMDRLEQLAKTEKPDLIVILGDVLHTHERLHTIPLNKAYELVNRMRKISKTYILVGNHDFIQNAQYLTTNHWMNGMKEWTNVVVVDKVTACTIQEITLVFCPYVPPGRFHDALTTLTSTDWKTANCIFAHQEFYGCKMGAVVSVDGDRWSDNFPPVVSGHIHSRQSLPNIYYCGSSMQNAFGESETNIIPILTWEQPGPYSLREIDLELPRKRIVYTDVQSVADYKIPEQSEDKIKITLSGLYDEFKAFKKTKKYRELVDSGTKVVFKPKKIEVTEENVPVEPVDDTDFHRILLELVGKERNTYLYQAFELVVNNKIVEEEDILFL